MLQSGNVNYGFNASYVYDAAGNRSQVVASGGPTVANASFKRPSIGSGYVYAPSAMDVSFTGTAGVAGNGKA